MISEISYKHIFNIFYFFEHFIHLCDVFYHSHRLLPSLILFPISLKLLPSESSFVACLIRVPLWARERGYLLRPGQLTLATPLKEMASSPPARINVFCLLSPRSSLDSNLQITEANLPLEGTSEQIFQRMNPMTDSSFSTWSCVVSCGKHFSLNTVTGLPCTPLWSLLSAFFKCSYHDLWVVCGSQIPLHSYEWLKIPEGFYPHGLYLSTLTISEIINPFISKQSLFSKVS